MLCIKRRVDETIVLHTSDGPITIMVTELQRGYAAYLGIKAPPSVKILRGELEELVRVAQRVLD